MLTHIFVIWHHWAKISYCPSAPHCLTHWGRVRHICVSKLIIIGSDNGLPPDRRQAIIWTNAGLLSIPPLRTYFSENLIKIQQFSLKKMHVKMLSAKWRPSCLGLNVLINCSITIHAIIIGRMQLFVQYMATFGISDNLPLYQRTKSLLIQALTCCCTDNKPLPKPTLILLIGPFWTNFSKIWIEIKTTSSKKMN